ncbi:MAG: DEAD/DEAH box helicase, partial [Planctomycetia bacterium]
MSDLQPTRTFASLGVPAPIVAALAAGGITAPFPIQAITLTDSLAGRDLLGRGKTGSGKTIAFAIPLVTALAKSDERTRQGSPRGLVLVPTRELAVQVSEEIRKLSNFMDDVRILAIYGGRSIDEQFKHLKRGVDIVVGTPGRIIDHLHRKTLDLSEVEFLVLDEADRMLDMGFIEDIDFILSKLPEKRQSMLFSATIPEGVRK